MRHIKIVSTAQEPQAVFDGKEVIQFGSNSYLGLTKDPYIISATIEAIKKYGTTSGASRWMSGNYDIALKLEQSLANFESKEDAMIFSSGYATNVGTISGICDKNSVIFSDELNHASIIDGARLSRGKIIVYKHCDLKDLTEKIKIEKPKKGLIVTDSIFSMDGDLAPIKQLSDIAHKNNLLLMIDEAHALGVLGKNSLEYLNLSSQCVDIIMGTLSKAIPAEGGFICANKEIIDFVKSHARSYIFSTGLAIGTMGAALATLEYLQNDQTRIKKLQQNISYFNKKLNEIGIKKNIISAIFPIEIGDEAETIQAAETMYKNGVFVNAITFPGVAKSHARLRFSLMATHTVEQLDYAIFTLEKVLKETNKL